MCLEGTEKSAKMTTTVSYIYSSGLDFGRKSGGHNNGYPRKGDIFTITTSTGATANGQRLAEDSLGKLEENSRRRSSGDLYASLRPFLIFGKFIGLVPIQGLFQRNVDRLAFSKSSFPAVVSVIIWFLLGVNVLVGFVGMTRANHTNAGQYAWAPATLIFYSCGLFSFVYFYKHSRDIISLLRNWRNMSLRFTKPDKTLFRDLNLIAGFVMTSAVLENVLSTINDFPLVPRSQDRDPSVTVVESLNASALEVYYIRSHESWASLVPYHPILGIYVFLSNKFALYAWNYMDITIALLSRALYQKFKVLCKQGEALLVAGGDGYDAEKWKELTKDHETLCSMLFQISSFLSPIVFTSFGINVYYVCLQLNLGLTPQPNQTVTQGIYAVWSFLHLVVRIYIISLSAARINDWAHRVSDIFRKCPNEAYTTEVERAERFVSVNTIGLTGLGCFVITKPLILQLVGVVFTFEIVLLQAAQTPLTDPSVANSTACKS